MITECPFFNEESLICEQTKHQCYKVTARSVYTVEQNEKNEYEIGDIVMVHFYTKLVPGMIVHRRGHWGTSVLFTDGKGNLRCSNANIEGLMPELWME